jgi:transcriptional regulator of arginine metabolism
MKDQRQAAILKIIRDRPVSTQEELADLLAATGIEVTQATVSRDIRELRLVKVAAGDGYRYAEPPQVPAADAHGRASRAFTEFVTGIRRSRNLIIVKTAPGTANAVAASIDEIAFSDIIATLAGDDVVLVVVNDPEEDNLPPPQSILQLEAALRRLWGQPL